MGFMSSSSGGSSGDSPALVDSSGTPTLQSGITEAEIKTLLNLEDADFVSAVQSESTLDLTGDVTVASAKSLLARRLPTVSLTANTTLTEGSHAGRYIFVTGSSIVITIPDNQGAGVHFTLLSNDANGFTLRTGTSGSTGDNMNGAQSDITVDARNGVTCISTGSDYVVLGA